MNFLKGHRPNPNPLAHIFWDNFLPVLKGGSVAVAAAVAAAVADAIAARVMVGVLSPLLARILGALTGSGGGGAQKLGIS